MGRSKKKSASSSGEFSLFDDNDSGDGEPDEDLPRDEVGRAKIKKQYVDLLGIRVQKLAGRILNRERINKTLEGIYFVCVRCQTVCHNLDEGLIEDDENSSNICKPCSKRAAEPPEKPAPKRSATAARKKKSVSRTKVATSKPPPAKSKAKSKTKAAKTTSSSTRKTSSSKAAKKTASKTARKTSPRKRR